MSDAIAIIPARGGSKRIPRKNIHPFMGRPMIEWTITAALDAACFARVLVSTDDEQIAACARAAGAEVPFLRKKHADDHSTVSQAVSAALVEAEDYWSTRFEVVAQLMPNCPLRTRLDVAQAMSHFYNHSADFQISVFRFGWMNPWWALQCNPDGTAQRLFPDAATRRSQDLPALFCPTGAIWIASCAAFKQAQNFYGPEFFMHELSWESAVDIDEPTDLRMAEAVAMTRLQAGNSF